MLGATIKETLKTIEGGETYDIWNLLPASAGGVAWLDEIKDGARRWGEWLDADKDYDISDLRDITGSIAGSEIEDYYANINKRVQELSLWACDEIDELLAEFYPPSENHYPTLTDLNSRYLFIGMHLLFDAIADQAYINSEDDRYSADLQDDMVVA
jgi:hypothetical protein